MAKTPKAILLGFSLLAASAAASAADEKPIVLKEGPGKDAVMNNCASCHSLDYIEMNSPFLNGEGWEKEVHKMIEAYHAPIDENDAKAIVEYLGKTYGP